MRPNLVHYVSNLTHAEAACGHWDRFMSVTPDPARVSCPACLRRQRAVDIPESALLRAIRQAAADHSWLTYHTRRSDGSEPGWFDLALAKPGYPLYLAELKTARGKLTMEQQRWQTTVAQCTGIAVALWRPADLPHILTLLRARSAAW